MLTYSLLNVGIDKSWHLNVDLSLILFLIILIPILYWLLGFLKITNDHDVQLNINLGGLGGVTIKPNHEVSQIAHQAWVELITRKAGLPIDIQNDVIVEIYNSWYALFGKNRELIKKIPANQLKNKDTKKLVDLLVDSLNKGLRPHLTLWQAKFRRWYNDELAKEENCCISPQEIQKRYPEYNLLVQDLTTINQQLVSYTNELKKLF